MATTSDGDEGESFGDQAKDIEELTRAVRVSMDLDVAERFAVEATRLALISLNRIACAVAGIELSYAALCDHILPEPETPPLTGDDE